MKFNIKNIGYMLVVFSLLLLLILIFVKRDLDTQGALLCEKFAEVDEMSLCPVHKTNTSWVLAFAFGIDFLLLGVGLYLIFMPSAALEAAKKELKKIDVSTLSDEEKKIYGIITQKQGSAYQTDLIQETGYSKVKLTRLLDKMELKGIVERKRRGMTNIVVMK